jgi:2,3-bisphosphoglycerate-independent phosphoglycerate mutase
VKALLVIADGLGCGPEERGNAITRKTMPRLFGWMREHGHAVLAASGEPVGLGKGQSGNSEAGHLTIGAGRRVPSLLESMGQAYDDGSYEANPLWRELAEHPVLHIIGLLSDSGVHGFWPNLVRAATLAGRHGIGRIHIHALLDGVDSQQGSAPRLLRELEQAIRGLPGVAVATVMGRRWACDRTGDLDTTRVLKAHLCGDHELPAFEPALLEAFLASGKGEKDFGGHTLMTEPFVGAGEPVLLVNHRADRTRQVAEVFAETHPTYALVELGDRVPLSRVFFPKQVLDAGVGFELRKHGIRSVRVAEQCKFPHVTFFFNGFNETLGEETVCVPSIPEAEIPVRPEMSAREVTAATLEVMRRGERAVVANFANTDQVGHTGQLDAVCRAAECVDVCLGEIHEACQEFGYTLIVTSDHGNADVMLDAEGRPLGSHSLSPVPIVVVPATAGSLSFIANEGSLANVGATFLTALGISPPAWMAPSLVAADADEGRA